jgi:DNA repair exonuclease SbcCD ATPase subunit
MYKIIVYSMAMVSILACSSPQESTKQKRETVLAEIKELRDSAQMVNSYKLEPRLLEKAKLEDTLNKFMEPFQNQIDIIRNQILFIEKEYENKTEKVKEQHFVKHGHDPDSYYTLEKTINNLLAQKNNEIRKYQERIKSLEGNYKSHQFFIQAKQDIELIETEIEHVNMEVRRFLKRIEELEDTLPILQPLP